MGRRPRAGSDRCGTRRAARARGTSCCSPATNTARRSSATTCRPRQYPRALTDLIKDPRQPGTVPTCAKLYPDPIHRQEDWGLVRSTTAASRAPTASRGTRAQVRRLRAARRHLRGKNEVSDWQFVPIPPTRPPAQPRGDAGRAEGARGVTGPTRELFGFILLPLASGRAAAIAACVRFATPRRWKMKVSWF